MKKYNENNYKEEINKRLEIIKQLFLIQEQLNEIKNIINEKK